jgi:3-oxoacyl-(acyl-carrier-protein) synthase
MTDRKTGVITGVGVASSYGLNKKKFYENYLAGKTPEIAERSITFFATQYKQKIYELPEFDEQAIPVALRRRMSFMSRMITVAAFQCLNEAKLSPEKYDDLSIVLGTGWGEHETITKLLSQLIADEPEITLSPTLFHNSVHNASAGYLGMILKAHGPALTISQGEHSFESALETGSLLLRIGQSQCVLVGCGDVFFDFAVLDQKKHTFPEVFSSGSNFFLLESKREASERHAPILAGCSPLPSYNSLQEPDISLYARDVVVALQEQNSIAPAEIDLVFLTGTGEYVSHSATISLLKNIFDAPIPILCSALHPERPTHGADNLLCILGILEEQRIPKTSIMHIWGNTASIKEEFRRVLWLSISPLGFYQIFLMEKG